MSFKVQIIHTIEVDAERTPQVIEALANLASVMETQAEDGLYLAGFQNAESVEIDGVDVYNQFLGDLTPLVEPRIRVL